MDRRITPQVQWSGPGWYIYDYTSKSVLRVGDDPGEYSPEVDTLARQLDPTGEALWFTGEDRPRLKAMLYRRMKLDER